jgi:hypothetical protein
MSDTALLEPVELTEAELDAVSGGLSLNHLLSVSLHNLIDINIGRLLNGSGNHNLNNVLNNSFNNLWPARQSTFSAAIPSISWLSVGGSVPPGPRRPGGTILVSAE